MSMKSMKITESEKKDKSMDSVMDRPSYPYGLKLHLDSDSFKKLGYPETPMVGEKCIILAQSEVTDVHQSESGDDRREISISLQITDMDIQKPEKEEKKEASSMLYGSSEG